MSRQHEWDYKFTGGMGCWVVCRNCAASDGVYATEEEAKIRVLALRHTPNMPTCKFGPVSPSSYGLSRRMRKAKTHR